MRISTNGIFVHVDYIICATRGNRREPIVYSCFERSEMAMRGFTANLSLNHVSLYPDETQKDGRIIVFPSAQMKSYHTKVMNGREPVYHGISISDKINQNYILTDKKNRVKDIFNWLMENFDLPLLIEWIPYFLEAGKDQILQIKPEIFGRMSDWMEDMELYEISMTDATLQDLVSNGLRSKKIKIADEEQVPLQFTTMDDYFGKYGSSLIENLEKKLNPLVDLKEVVDEIAFLTKRFYPQQAAIVNGLMECMRYSSYAFLNEDMGCGKTLQGMGVLEGFFNKKIMEETQKSIKGVYLDKESVKYRNIVMCPSHLVEKWAESIRTDIPYARVTIIRNLKELQRLEKRGKARTGKEFYVMSKDTGKLSYTYQPLPTQVKFKKAATVVCKECGDPRSVSMPKECQCGSKEWVFEDTSISAEGLICPECSQLLYPADIDIFVPDGEKQPLHPFDFATQTKANRICRHCGTLLWQPACEPVNRTLSFQPLKFGKKKWVKMTHYANKAKKNKKTVWVHEHWKEAYIAENELLEDEISYPKVTGVRRYAPSRYIKKYLKGYFDFAIFDEAHEYKGGGSAQGLAMHDLVQASKWQLALTGTIAGGYANHFFYLLYRLDPRKMKAMGYNYGAEGERKFIEKYGTIATEYEVEENNNSSYHSMSRGKMIGSPKCRPGISARIFTDFLLDKAVFLNLSDMSSFLPPLKEMVEYIPLENEIYSAYSGVRDKLKKAMIERKLGNAILGSYLQFSLSYTDKPNGREPILSPIDGSLVAEIPDLSHLIEDGKLLNKERRLCELVEQEIAEGRNVFVYCEYTGSGETNVTRRLKEIMIRNCGLREREVGIIESSYPPAEDREAWMHEMASKGVRVFITNPKCVKTGLDFLFSYETVVYNYPTIIYYQYSYDLFTMWQASRRHYRLNQILECRTYYLLSERTIQIDALEMVASKQVATSAIQGQFSSEGLCAMAQGVDPRIKLAQAATEKSPDQMKGLKSMFDVLNQWHTGSDERKEHKLMPTFKELTGIDISDDDMLLGGALTGGGSAWSLFGLLLGEDEMNKASDHKDAIIEEEEENRFIESIVDSTQKMDEKKDEIEPTSLFHSFFMDSESFEVLFQREEKSNGMNKLLEF